VQVRLPAVEKTAIGTSILDLKVASSDRRGGIRA
jgi:hypothetical protein